MDREKKQAGSGQQEQKQEQKIQADEQQQGSSSGEGQSEGAGRSGTRKKQPSPWEWGVAVLGALLVLGAVGFMLYEALNGPSTPPQIEVAVDRVLETGTGYVVEFTARNRGQTTAAGLVIEGELRRGTESVEKSQVTIDYVPAESSRQGGLFFSHDPAVYELEIRPKGYDKP